MRTELAPETAKASFATTIAHTLFARAEGRIDGALTTYETTKGRGLEQAFIGGTIGLDPGLVVQIYAMSETVWSKLSNAQRDGLTAIGRSVEKAVAGRSLWTCMRRPRRLSLPGRSPTGLARGTGPNYAP